MGKIKDFLYVFPLYRSVFVVFLVRLSLIYRCCVPLANGMEWRRRTSLQVQRCRCRDSGYLLQNLFLVVLFPQLALFAFKYVDLNVVSTRSRSPGHDFFFVTCCRCLNYGRFAQKRSGTHYSGGSVILQMLLFAQLCWRVFSLDA